VEVEDAIVDLRKELDLDPTRDYQPQDPRV